METWKIDKWENGHLLGVFSPPSWIKKEDESVWIIISTLQNLKNLKAPTSRYWLNHDPYTLKFSCNFWKKMWWSDPTEWENTRGTSGYLVSPPLTQPPNRGPEFSPEFSRHWRHIHWANPVLRQSSGLKTSNRNGSYLGFADLQMALWKNPWQINKYHIISYHIILYIIYYISYIIDYICYIVYYILYIIYFILYIIYYNLSIIYFILDYLSYNIISCTSMIYHNFIYGMLC
jgi:hypothetical protein